MISQFLQGIISISDGVTFVASLRNIYLTCFVQFLYMVFSDFIFANIISSSFRHNPVQCSKIHIYTNNSVWLIINIFVIKEEEK